MLMMKREQNKKTKTDDDKTFPSLSPYKTTTKAKKKSIETKVGSFIKE